VPPAVVALSLSAFVIGTAEFVTSGLLSDLLVTGWRSPAPVWAPRPEWRAAPRRSLPSSDAGCVA